MKILDRYLHAVAFWLPAQQKNDITAELSEEIRSQIEEREAELGRPLTEEELESILKAWGSPLIVAERYLQQSYLIGPAVFPIYTLLLRKALLYSFLPWIAVWIGLAIFSPDFRAQHSGNLAGEFVKTVFLAAVNIFAFVTAAFAIVDRVNARSGFLERWNPRQLPAVRDPLKISRAATINEIVWGAIVLVWWLNARHAPAIPLMRISPAQYVYYWPIVVLQVGLLSLACAKALHPYWTRGLSIVSLVLNSYGLLVAGLMLASGPWLEARGNGVSAATPLLQSLNIACLITLVAIAASYLIYGFKDWRRLRGNKSLPHAVLSTS